MRSMLACCAIVLLAATIHAEALEIGIGAMLVGKQMLEVTDNRQMTLRADGNVISAFVSPDGRYVVYYIHSQKRNTGECRLAKISTGKTVTIMDASSIIDDPENWPPAGVTSTAGSRVAWSPDSSQFALGVTHFTREGDAESQEQCVAIYSASGAHRKTLPLPETTGLGELLFSRDSKKLLMGVSTKDIERSDATGQRLKHALHLVDIGTGASREIYTSKSWLDPHGWTEGGSLLCGVRARTSEGVQRPEIHRIALDGGSDEVVVPDASQTVLYSPDATLRASGGGMVWVTAQATGKQTEIAKDGDFLGWAPNGRMVFYEKRESIRDASVSVRTRDFQSMWLSSIQPGKLDRVCVALDAEGSPSCSRDCSRIAYISQGQLYIAELTLRDPTVDEKIVAGLPLSEDEMKQALLTNGRQIGQAIMMYAADYDDALPPADSVQSAIGNYLSNKDVFLRPGGQDGMFRYRDPGVANNGEIEHPADTVLGELDGGYNWIVEIYADGHVVVKPKQ